MSNTARFNKLTQYDRLKDNPRRITIQLEDGWVGIGGHWYQQAELRALLRPRAFPVEQGACLGPETMSLEAAKKWARAEKRMAKGMIPYPPEELAGLHEGGGGRRHPAYRS